MVIATLRPRSEPSASCSPAILFKTGACWATQSILRCPSGAREGSLTSDSPIMVLLLYILFYRPNSASSTQRPVYNQGKLNALASISTLESQHRREAQIQDHGRLGELRDHPGDLAALHLRHAPCLEALSFEALGSAILPGHGRQRAAYDLLPVRVQWCPQARDTHPPLRRVPHTLAGRSQVLPAARHRLHALWRGLHRAAHGGVKVGGRFSSTAASVPGRSVMITSTPRSSRRLISSAWFMVHASTLTPLACAARTKRGVTTVIPLCLRGTCSES